MPRPCFTPSRPRWTTRRISPQRVCAPDRVSVGGEIRPRPPCRTTRRLTRRHRRQPREIPTSYCPLWVGRSPSASAACICRRANARMRLLCCLNQRRRCAFAVIRTGLRRRHFLPAADERLGSGDGAACLALPVSGAAGTSESSAAASLARRTVMLRVASHAATVPDNAVPWDCVPIAISFSYHDSGFART
jgi:hypothetical protein